MYCITNDFRKIESIKNPSYQCITRYISIKCPKKRVSSGKNWRYGKWCMQCTQKHRFTHWFFPLLLQSLGVHPISRQNHPIDIDIDSQFVLVLHSTSQLYRVCVALPAAPRRTQYQALSRQEAGDVTLLFWAPLDWTDISLSKDSFGLKLNQ